MPRNLKSDLLHLQSLAFRRHAQIAPLLHQFHALKKPLNRHPARHLLWNLYDWLLVPLSLWPIDLSGLARAILDSFSSSPSSSSSTASISAHPSPSAVQNFLVASIETQKPEIENSTIFILHLIGSPPPPETQRIIADFERDIESGRYEKMLKHSHKFDEQEHALLHNEQLVAEWAELKQRFDVSQFQNARGIIRRRLSLERNFREADWPFDPSDPKRLFHFCFDAFCYRWKLYGMEYDRPLLLKISVNPTPHGTMLLIPRHWSLDPRRDLDWSLINRLHRVRGAKKSGPKYAPARIEQLSLKKLATRAFASARKQRITGEKLHEFMCAALNRDPRSDPSTWKRLIIRKPKPRDTSRAQNSETE